MTKFKKKINLVKKVILAAGSSKRYGEENKLVQIFQKKPLQQDMPATFKRSNERDNNSEQKSRPGITSQGDVTSFHFIDRKNSLEASK